HVAPFEGSVRLGMFEEHERFGAKNVFGLGLELLPENESPDEEGHQRQVRPGQPGSLANSRGRWAASWFQWRCWRAHAVSPSGPRGHSNRAFIIPQRLNHS